MACLLQETLSLEGYSVEVTSSADDALEIARERHPDLVLLESHLSDQTDGRLGNMQSFERRSRLVQYLDRHGNIASRSIAGSGSRC